MEVGFVGLLTIVLVALKVIGIGHYSWLIAFSPMIAGAAIAAAFFLLAGLLMLVFGAGLRRWQ